VHPGDVVAGRFEIEAIAGTGGMGTVYRARDRAAGERVALKTLSAIGARDAARFAREASVLSDLVHPGIVRYIAHGMTPQHEHYIAMEWLEGETLQQRLLRGRMSIGDAVALVRAIAEAVAAAHRRGVVHRDIKPANIMLPGGDIARVKVLDFGIARHVEQAGLLTNTGTVIGTPGYMAPEQVRGDTGLGPRTDVFALGCVLYRCLTGASAFGGDQSLAVLAKILVEDVAPASSIVAEVPPALDALVARMLAKQPAERPADAGEVALQLAAIVDATLRAGAPSAMASTAHAEPLSEAETELRPRATTAPSGQVLTASEQRMISMVLCAGSTGEPTRIQAAAAAYGGRLERIADGASLVLFADGVATDLAMRAARCALALRDILGNAPLVVASGRAAIERMPVGAVIDRAATALAGAQPGQIVLDDGTANLLDERFVLDEHRHLRGLREGAEPARTLLGRATSMVGRDRELAMLESLWQEAAEEPVARAVLVTAPPGAGKSRLRQELVRRVLQRDAHAEIMVARGDAVRAGSPFAMLADAIRRAAGIREGDPLEEQRAGLEARVSALPDAPRLATLLGEIAGVAFPSNASEALRAARADPVARADAMRGAFVDWLAAESARHPVLLVLEDLHWGDRATVDYVGSALRQLAGSPLLVLALARPEIHDAFPKLWADRELQEIRLPALTRKAGERLVRDLLGDDVSQGTVQKIVDRSGGNAFFLEELIRAVAHGHAEQLPESVLAMLELRLGELGADQRRVLRAASVFGEVFWRGGVAMLLGGEPRDHLASLIERELITHQPGSRLPGEVQFAFRHDLVREAAYQMMSAHDRTLGHKLAGDWLVQHGFGDALALAGHFRKGDDLPRAAEYYARAAAQALSGNDNSAALAHGDSGLACNAEGEVAGRLHLVRAEALNWMGQHMQSIPAAEQAAALLPRGSKEWFQAHDELCYGAGRSGQQQKAMAVMGQLTSTTAAPGGELAQLRSVARAAILMFRFGPSGVGDALLSRVEQLATGITLDTDTDQRLHTLRAMSARTKGKVDDALAGHVAALRGCQASHNLREEAFTYLAYGGVYHELGAPLEAKPILAKGLEVAQRVGASTVEMLLEFSIAICEWQLGRYDEARAHAQRAAVGASENDRGVAGFARFVLANVALETGDLETAEQEAREALSGAPFPEYRALMLATMTRIHLRRGRIDEALATAADAKRIMVPHDGFQDGESVIRLAEIEALEAAGQHDAAAEATRIAIARLEQRAARLDEKWRDVFLAKRDNAATLARRPTT
jgi:tetratricopeptide (TPR) repeat protein